MRFFGEKFVWNKRVLLFGTLFVFGILPFFATAASVSFGSEAVFKSANVDVVSTVGLDSTHAVVVYRINSNSQAAAVVATISGSTITYGSEVVFNAASTGGMNVTAIDSTHVVIAYQDTGNSSQGTAIVGTVSGTSISFGSETVFNAATTGNSFGITAIDSTNVVIAFQDSANSAQGTAIVGTVSGSSISFGSEAIFNAADTGAATQYVVAASIDSTKVVIAYRDVGNTNQGTAIVGTVSGTSISFGSEAVFNAATTAHLALVKTDSTHVVIVFQDGGDTSRGHSVVGEVSGTSISFGSEVTIDNDTVSTLSLADFDSTYVTVIYASAFSESYARLGTVSGTTISFGSRVNINAAGATGVKYATQIDSSHVISIYADSGNSSYGTGIIGTLAVPISIGGTVYTDEGVTNIGANKTVAVSVNGAAAAGTDDTDASGVYSIPNITVSAGDILTLYLDGETEKAVVVTATAGSNMTGIDLYQNYLITRHDNSGSLTNANLETAETNADADISAIYSVSSSNLTVASGKSLYIPSSHTFAPGGTVSVGGNFSNNGTFTHGSSTVTLTGTSTQTLKTNSSALNNLTINGSGGTYTLQDALDVNDTITISAGTLDVGSDYGITAKSWTDTGSGTFTEGSGTVTFDVTGGTINSNETFENVTINHGGTTTLGAALDLDDTLTITSGALDVSGSNYGITAKSWTDTGAGTFTEQSGTVTFDVAGGTINANETFYNVTVNHAGTTTLGAAMTLGNTLTITSGTLDASSGNNYAISVGGSFSNAGTFTARSGTVTFTATATGKTITSGGSSFYDLTFNGSGGGWTLQDALTVSNALTITNGTLSGGSQTITLSGTGTIFSNSGTYTAGTSTIAITNTSSTSKTFAGGGGTFNHLSITASGSGAVIFTGANTFNNFTINAPKTVTFPASTTTTITGTFSCTGSSGNVITINSSSSGTAATLSKASGTVSCDYLSLQDSAATGGATWNPGSSSTSVSGNSGWLFNSAPSITAGPSDGSSSSTSPTNVGSNVTFTATATDSNSDNYYLAICKTNAVTAVNSGAPTCDGGSWAISSSTASGAQASVTYTALSGDSESNAWYAFVCDNNSSSLCSAVSQGSGDAGSPFAVNHAPAFSATANSGGPATLAATVTFTSTASDSDSSGSADTVTLYICKANDFSSGSCGAGGEWASSSAASSNPSATYVIQSGDSDGTKTYYANVVDNHGFSSASNPRSSTFVIDKTAPVVSAGSDQSTFSQFTQDATVSDATSGVASYQWSKQSGSGTITFGTDTAEDTTISASATGTYVIRLTVTDNAGNSNYDEFTLTWSPTSSGGGGNAYVPTLAISNPVIPVIPAPPLEDQEKIQALLKVIESLKAQIQKILTERALGVLPRYVFTRNLSWGDVHADVKKLQQFLNSQGFLVATSGPGSLGNETERFGFATRNALIKFQEAHAAEILLPSGLSKGNGLLGPVTRNYINSLP